jgi:hypothetical protein
MLGLSSSRQSSSSFSSSLDVSQSAANSDSLSYGSSQSTSGGRSTQTIAFADLLAQLYGGATDATMSAVAEAPLFADEAAQLFKGGAGFLDRLQNVPGADYLAGRLTGPDAAAQAQIDALRAESGRLFNEELMPGITSRGIATGTLGGSRQGVAIGRAAGEVGRGFSGGVAQILANSQAARDAIASTLGGQSVAAAGTAFAGIPSLLNASQAGANAGLSPYAALADILGGPTVLTESSQQSQATSEDLATAISRAYSSSYGTSSSSSTSKGKSVGLSFG